MSKYQNGARPLKTQAWLTMVPVLSNFYAESRYCYGVS